MRCPVYRSLDKPSAFFGIRGRFIYWMVGLLLAAGAVGLLVGAVAGTFIGILAFLLGGVAAYAFILRLQGRSSDRAFSLRMNAKKYVRYVRTPPGAFRHMWNHDR